MGDEGKAAGCVPPAALLSEFQPFCAGRPADFMASNVKLRIAHKPSDGLWAKSPKRDECHGGPSRIAQNLAARVHVRSPMKRKLLLAVVWIVLAGGIAALIIFPPDSVLTAEFRH